MDTNPPFMVRLMPAPPGLTGKHARLRIWQPILDTDGLSVQHHLLCFFQPGRCQDQAQAHLASYIQWEKVFFSSHCLTGQWASSLKVINPASPPLASADWFKPEWVPSGGLVLSAFHNPAPTGSYGTLSWMDWLWNIGLVKQFNTPTPPSLKKAFLGKLTSFHISSAIYKYFLSVYFPCYCMYGSVPPTKTQYNNWGKFQSMLPWFTSCTMCASDQLKSMLPGTWTALLLPNQSIGQDKSYHWLCRRRPPVASQAHLSTLWWAWDSRGPWFSFPHCSAST